MKFSQIRWASWKTLPAIQTLIRSTCRKEREKERNARHSGYTCYFRFYLLCVCVCLFVCVNVYWDLRFDTFACVLSNQSKANEKKRRKSSFLYLNIHICRLKSADKSTHATHQQRLLLSFFCCSFLSGPCVCGQGGETGGVIGVLAKLWLKTAKVKVKSFTPKLNKERGQDKCIYMIVATTFIQIDLFQLMKASNILVGKDQIKIKMVCVNLFQNFISILRIEWESQELTWVKWAAKVSECVCMCGLGHLDGQPLTFDWMEKFERAVREKHTHTNTHRVTTTNVKPTNEKLIWNHIMF